MAAVVQADGRALKVEDDTLIVNTDVPSPTSPTNRLSARMPGASRVGWQVVFLWIALALTPGARLRMHWPFALFAVSAVFALHVLNMTMEILHRVESIRVAHGMPLLGDSHARALVLLSENLSVVSPFLAVVACVPLWIVRSPHLHPKAPEAGTPRNAPCPCGSGRKSKRCCQT